MADTIKLPGIGPTKKHTVYIAGGVLLAAVGVYYWRNRTSAAAATDTTATTDTTDTSSEIDPATGYAYGSAEDQAALAGQYSYDSTGTVGTTSNSTPATSVINYTSNPQWSQAAEDYLANTVGLDATTVQAALGKYLTGSDVTDAQQAIIEQAIASEGYPPQSGNNGYPPSIRTAPATTTTPPPNSSALPKLGTPHIYVTAKGKTGDLRIHWNPVPHAGFYLVSGNHGGLEKVAATQHPNFLVKPPSTVHVTAFPTGYNDKGQRVKYAPYLASDPSNSLTARKP